MLKLFVDPEGKLTRGGRVSVINNKIGSSRHCYKQYLPNVNTSGSLLPIALLNTIISKHC